MSLHDKIRELETQKRDVLADLKVANAMMEDYKAKAETATTRMLSVEASLKVHERVALLSGRLPLN